MEARPTLAELLRNREPESFAPDELMRKAHWRWGREDPHAAFLLFDAALQRALSEGKVHRAEAARNRAAITLFQSGQDLEEALRRLEEVIEYYRERRQAASDSHFAEWAASALLEHRFRTDPGGFAEAFWKLVERLDEAGLNRYPSIRPQRVRIAEMAREVEARGVLARLLPHLKDQRPMHRALKQQIRKWEAWLAT